MNVTSYDIATMLQAESALGLEYTTNLFIGTEPTSPDNCVTVYDTPGDAPDLTMDITEYNRPSVQVAVRNRVYTDGWDLINSIKGVLHGTSHLTWNGTRYELILCSGEPAPLGWDDTGKRVRFVANFNVQRY